jgi:SAM-dependent methyltransferase
MASADHVGEVTDFLLGTTARRFKAYRCRGCTAIYLYPPPSPQELAAFYPEGYWWREMTSQARWPERVVNRLEKAYRDFMLRDHLRFVLRVFDRPDAPRPAAGAELLDVGCGGGAFLNLCRQHGFKVYGLESSATAVEHARTTYGLSISCGSIENGFHTTDKKYDVITMFHVLEHLLDPVAALRSAAELLKPDGHLIVQVPNIDSVQARLFKERWYGMDPPRHLVNFNRRALETALDRAGLAIESIRYFSLRDNAPAFVSSLFPGLDPMRRKVRPPAHGGSGLAGFIMELLYFSLVLLTQPLALLESAIKRGATIMVHAVRKV